MKLIGLQAPEIFVTPGDRILTLPAVFGPIYDDIAASYDYEEFHLLGEHLLAMKPGQISFFSVAGAIDDDPARTHEDTIEKPLTQYFRSLNCPRSLNRWIRVCIARVCRSSLYIWDINLMHYYGDAEPYCMPKFHDFSRIMIDAQCTYYYGTPVTP